MFDGRREVVEDSKRRKLRLTSLTFNPGKNQDVNCPRIEFNKRNFGEITSNYSWDCNLRNDEPCNNSDHNRCETYQTYQNSQKR